MAIDRMIQPTIRGRALGVALLAWSLAIVGCGPPSSSDEFSTVRIGYQKTGTLNLLRLRGQLEPELAKQGVEIRWVAFPAGPQLLEALNAGSIDYGHTGDTPPILAQAAGVPFVYVACEPERPRSEAILVPPGSPIKRLVDLKGKRIALNKGSNVHYLLVRALETAGIAFDEVRPVYLSPADARAAFTGGSVDAWAVWDPYYADAELSAGAVLLADATGLAGNREFQLSSKSLAERRPEVIRAIVETLGREADWIGRHRDESIRLLVAELGLGDETVRRVITRKAFGVVPIDDDVIKGQQKLADTFRSLGLIPRPIVVRDAILAPGPVDVARAGR
jgi:sulfonate transport system substrate-binding protein